MSNLTDDQKLFVREAEEAGLSIDYSFVGRFESGASCPAVKVGSLQSFRTSARGAQWDKLGSEYVIYCPVTYW